jgi:uncharacterized membrane protein
MSPALLAICAYFFLVIGGLVVSQLERKNRFVLFHAWQSLVTGAFAVMLQFVFIWNGTLNTLCWIAYFIFTVAMMAIVIRDSPSQTITHCKQKSERAGVWIRIRWRRMGSLLYLSFALITVPFIGRFCEQRADNRVREQTVNDSYDQMMV